MVGADDAGARALGLETALFSGMPLGSWRTISARRRSRTWARLAWIRRVHVYAWRSGSTSG